MSNRREQKRSRRDSRKKRGKTKPSKCSKAVRDQKQKEAEWRSRWDLEEAERLREREERLSVYTNRPVTSPPSGSSIVKKGKGYAMVETKVVSLIVRCPSEDKEIGPFEVPVGSKIEGHHIVRAFGKRAREYHSTNDTPFICADCGSPLVMRFQGGDIPCIGGVYKAES